MKMAQNTHDGSYTRKIKEQRPMYNIILQVDLVYCPRNSYTNAFSKMVPFDSFQFNHLLYLQYHLLKPTVWSGPEGTR